MGLYEILVCYDFDADSTLPYVKQAQEKYPEISDKIRLVKNDIAKSPTGAIRAGIEAANGDYILVNMADMSDDTRVISSVVYYLEKKRWEGPLDPDPQSK